MMYEKAESKKGYDKSVLMAVDAIQTLGVPDDDEESSIYEDIHTSHAGQTPKFTANGRNIIPSFRVASRVKPFAPFHDVVQMENLSAGRKSWNSLFPNASETEPHSFIGSKFDKEEPPVLGKIDFYRTRLDESDVIKLVPFILEAGVLVNGKIETVEDAKGISEGQKSSIGFLAIQTMSRALKIAARKDGSASTIFNSSTESLNEQDQEHVICRARNLKKEYMHDVRSIYAKLVEKFGTPECNDTLIGNLSNSLRILGELENNGEQAFKQTAHALDYVENVFKIAIEQYGPIEKSGSVQSSGFKGNKRRGGAPRLDPRVPNRHHGEISKYRAIVNRLFPLIEANLGNYSDADQIRQKMAYTKAFLKMESVPNGEVLQSAKEIIDEFCERFAHLPRDAVARTVGEDVSDVLNDWPGTPLLGAGDWPGALDVEEIFAAGSRKEFEWNGEDDCFEDDQDDEESEEVGVGEKVEEMINFCDNEEDCQNDDDAQKEGEVDQNEEEEEKDEVKQETEEVNGTEEESQETSIEAFTPRRSKRSAVVAARVNRGEASSSGCVVNSRAANSAGQSSGSRSRGTPGRIPRNKKTPKKI